MFILLCPMLQKEHLEREIEKLSVRTNFLGKDRNHFRYWFFRRERRLFVESSDSMQWGYYSTKEEVIILWTCVIMLHPFFGLQLRCWLYLPSMYKLDALLGSLNPKGERERGLKRQLEKYYNRIRYACYFLIVYPLSCLLHTDLVLNYWFDFWMSNYLCLLVYCDCVLFII